MDENGHSTSRALAPLAGDIGSARPAPSAGFRADAAFLAHLLAVRTQAPEQRAKRRAAPERGAAAYRSGLGLLSEAPRGTLGIRA